MNFPFFCARWTLFLPFPFGLVSGVVWSGSFPLFLVLEDVRDRREVLFANGGDFSCVRAVLGSR